MSTKVDQTSTTEPRHVQTTVAITSSAASSSSPKVSMFGAKSGFVIPKNKLSGSLVPIFRAGKKLGGSSDAATKENSKLTQRKTKWGPDITHDAAVRRGRALAYQTRLDQITQQLKSGSLGIGDAQDSSLAAQVLDQESSGHQNNTEKLKLLELERREVIGEILTLNPSYKAPPDYKPVLKEARVPIPVKEYPGYNFIGLICGPGSDTVKRLEKETGAKVQVYGTKADKGEKGEIIPSDGNESQGAYEELYIHVSADTFEKVDAAVALIELLVTPVSGNPAAVPTTSTSVSADNVNVPNQNQDSANPYTNPTAVVNQGGVQPAMGLAQNPPQGQFQPHPRPWIPTGLPHTLVRPSSGIIPPSNFSAPILNSPVHLSAPPFSSPSLPSLFGPPPAPAAAFGSVIQNPLLISPRPQQPMQVLQHPYMPLGSPLSHMGPPRNPSMPQPAPAQPQVPGAFTSSQSTPTGLPSISRPLMPSLPALVSKPPQGMPPDQPLAPAGSSSGWSGGPAGTPASLGSSNAVQRPPPLVPLQGPRPIAPQPIVASRAPPTISAANMVPPLSFPSGPSGPQLSSTSVNQPVAVPVSSASLPPIPVPSPTPTPTPVQASLPLMPVHAVTARASVPNPSLNSVLGSAPVPLPMASTSAPPVQAGISGSVSGSLPRFMALKPVSLTAPRLQHPSSSDFTFQPVRAQNPASQATPRPGSQLATQSTPPPKLIVQPPLAPQAPSFRPAMPNSAPQPVLQAFPRPQVSNQLGQPQAQVSPVPFAGNPNAVSAMPRLPPFPAAPTTPVAHMGLRNSGPAPQMPNLAGPFPSRPGNPVQLQQNYPATVIRPEGIGVPNQQFSNNLPFASGKPASSPSGGQQIYDPFSPTSVSHVPQQGSNLTKVKKQENDPEYEDLMASVGVR